jgi:hypothetical protein
MLPLGRVAFRSPRLDATCAQSNKCWGVVALYQMVSTDVAPQHALDCHTYASLKRDLARAHGKVAFAWWWREDSTSLPGIELYRLCVVTCASCLNKYILIMSANVQLGKNFY